jgi:rhodanese-related sulfurtransferase
MSLLDQIKQRFGARPGASVTPPAEPAAEEPEPPETPIPEVSARDLLAELSSGPTPVFLDCRESYERRQGYIPGSIHIPMNTIPGRLDELERAAPIVVYCAHGNRSFGVAGWLNARGYRTRSLRGGIVEWQRGGGAIEKPGAGT